MPTNEERQDIAENLRIMTSYGCKYAEQFYELLKETVMDSWDFHEFGDVADRLADLIEPEERTCHMTKYGPEYVLSGWWACSECGPVYPPCNEEIAEWALKKCPRCGAKVVKE